MKCEIKNTPYEVTSLQ